MFTTYESVRGLDEQALRALARRGDPRERVWAAWALGVRLGPSFTREAVAAVDGEPSSGARRHLIVMLAGFQERRIIEALALHDPDELVRATACQNLVRISTCEQDLALPLDRATEDTSPWVRAAILRAAAGRWPESRIDPLLALAEDPTAFVRTVAIDRLSETMPLDDLMTRFVVRRLPQETNGRILRQLRGLCRRAGRLDLATTAAKGGSRYEAQRSSLLPLALD